MHCREADVAVLRWVYKKSRELVRRMGFYRGEYPDNHPVFPTGSTAVCQDAAGPVDNDAPDIMYTTEDDNAIDKFSRDYCKSSSWLNHEYGFTHDYIAATSFHAVSYSYASISTTYLICMTQLGTCAMKKRDKAGVVDENLNVYGVQGLKVTGESVVSPGTNSLPSSSF